MAQVSTHKGAETIQERKLFKGGNYMRKYGTWKNKKTQNDPWNFKKVNG